MDRRLQKDQLQEGTAKPTGKAGPKPWDMKRYISEKQKEDQSLSHSDPRLDQHQDSEFIPSDGDHGYGSPVFGRGFTPEFDASASTASDQGTLAGGGCLGKQKTVDRLQRQKEREARAEYNHRLARSEWELQKSDAVHKRINRLRPR
jgi:hypothetical protein